MVRALTLWRPWTTAILYGPKRAENRPIRWHIPEGGLLLAIHGGKKFDSDGAQKIRSLWSEVDDHEHPTGIVGACRVTEMRRYSQKWAGDDPWIFGPYCYLLDDVVPFPEPIALLGQRGMFRLDPDIEAYVVQLWERAADPREYSRR